MDAYIEISGGLGDFFADYFSILGNPTGWGRVKSWKQANPDSRLRAIALTHNYSIRAFLSTNPAIDEVVVHWRRSNWMLTAGIVKELAGDRQDLNTMTGYPWACPSMYLDKEETAVMNELRASGPYICIHPFAGSQERRFDAAGIDTTKFVAAAREFGLGVVILGRTHPHMVNEAGRETGTLLAELYPEEPDGVRDLVGAAGPRLSCAIAMEAVCFVGTHSCYQVAAWCSGVPSLCLAPSDMPVYWEGAPSKFFIPFRRPGNVLVHFEKAREVGERGLLELFRKDPAAFPYDAMAGEKIH